MAYQENATVATPDVIINNLASFCAGAGWTVERNNLVGTNRTLTLRKAGVTDYIHVYNTDATQVRMRISIGYDALLPPATQPNVSGENRTTLGAGAYPKSFMFASQDQVWVVVAIAASGEYRHFTFGRLEKMGAYTGGTYIDGTAWPNTQYYATWTQNTWPFSSTFTGAQTGFRSPGYLRCDIADDAKENYFFRMEGVRDSPEHAFGEAGSNGREARLTQFADENAFSGRSILHAIPIFVGRVGTVLYHSPAGVVQDVRICSIQKFDPEQEFTIGTDTWKVFPIVGKRPMNTVVNLVQPAASGNYAYAIKKIA